MKNDFLKYATAQGLNSMHVEKVLSQSANTIQSSYGYISPTILEERQLNVTQMDVFSRLMMDRVIFLGTEINDYTANVIQAQLLYLDSVDSERDINLYLNTPPAVLSMPDSVSTIRCSSAKHAWLPSVRASQPLWAPFCSWQENKVCALLCRTAV